MSQIWAPTVPLPLDQNELLVPHLKDPIHICLDIEAQERGMTFRTCYAQLIYP